MLDKNKSFPPLGVEKGDSEGDDLPNNRRELRIFLRENRRDRLISDLVSRLNIEVMETLIRVIREEIKQTERNRQRSNGSRPVYDGRNGG